MIVKVCKVHGELTAEQCIARTDQKSSFRCKACKREQGYRRYIENKEAAHAANRASYAKNKEKEKIKSREYYLKNKEKILARNAQWKLNNPDKNKELNKKSTHAKDMKRMRAIKEDPVLYAKECERNRIRGLKVRSELRDSYMRRLLVAKDGLTQDEIKYNPAILELKRMILKIKRAIKNDS